MYTLILYACMVKNISLNEEAYKKLLIEKRPDESFNDVVLRLLPKRCNLKDVVGKKLISSDIIFEEIRKSSLKSTERIINENT